MHLRSQVGRDSADGNTAEHETQRYPSFVATRIQKACAQLAYLRQGFQGLG
jgi:hypothetical protein